MGKLSARIAELEARALTVAAADRARHIHEWLLTHGIETPEPERGMTVPEWLRIVSTEALSAMMALKDGQSKNHAIK